MKKFLTLAAALSAGTASFAHEGHGNTNGYTITHYFTEPVHVIPMLVALVVAIVLAYRFRKVPVKK